MSFASPRLASAVDAKLPRRSFVRLAGAATLAALAPAGCKKHSSAPPVADLDRLVRFPGKVPLRLLTDRPPQLETPLPYFLQDFTPNEAFFVRWHLSDIPTEVDTRTFRLRVGGAVQRPLALSLDELRTTFEPVTVAALNQCSGNARSLFDPRVPGGQWGNGAMGNAQWTGVRVKDLLARAGLAAKAVEVTFGGLDAPPLPSVPDFVKSLAVDHASDGEVLVAYAMNGAELPMLNGFPLRLVVPGWYATYWVKALDQITVLDHPFEGFWMKKAYLLPDNAFGDESPGHLATNVVPITTMGVHSIFLRPGPAEVLTAGRPCVVEGLAVDGGHGIRRVEISTDGGQGWSEATLQRDLGRYSWRRWRSSWTPPHAGAHTLLVRATNEAGEGQVTRQWNHGGYRRSVIERLDVSVGERA